MRLEDLPLEDRERMLWTLPGWQGWRAAVLELPVLAIYAFVVIVRLGEVAHRRLTESTELLAFSAKDALEGAFFLGCGVTVAALVLGLRGRTYFVTSRRVGVAATFPLGQPVVTWSHATSPPEERALRGRRVQLTWTSPLTFTAPPSPCGRVPGERVSMTVPRDELPALRAALTVRQAEIAPRTPSPPPGA